MDIQQAAELAKSQIAPNQRLTGAYEGTEHWFFIIGDELVDIVPGFSPIAISKADGSGSFPIPTIPYELTGKEPIAEELEMDRAHLVSIPKDQIG